MIYDLFLANYSNVKKTEAPKKQEPINSSNPFEGVFNYNSTDYMTPFFMQDDFFSSLNLFNDFLGGKMPMFLQTQVFDSKFNTKTNLAALKNVYNQDLGNKLANIANKTALSKNTIGYCYGGVKDALKRAGITDNRLGGGSAYMAKEILQKHRNFKEVSVSKNDLKNLPAGCVIVWQPYNDRRGKYHEHGHIAVTLGNGKEASDHVQNLVIADKYSVFVPVGTSKKA